MRLEDRLEALAPHVEARWRERFLTELGLQGASAPAISDALVEVETHCRESGRSAENAFAHPGDYARALQLPDQARWSPAQLAATWAKILLLVVGVWAIFVGASPEPGGQRAQIDAGLVLSAALYLVLMALVARFARTVLRLFIDHKVWTTAGLHGPGDRDLGDRRALQRRRPGHRGRRPHPGHRHHRRRDLHHLERGGHPSGHRPATTAWPLHPCTRTPVVADDEQAATTLTHRTARAMPPAAPQTSRWEPAMSDAGMMQRLREIAPPRGTWVFMVLALALTLLLTPLTDLVFEWFGNATLWPLALILTVFALGLAGAVIAVREGCLLWALLSALWGPVLVYALYEITLIIWGP